MTAGAGTGKTTTLDCLARRLLDLGHENIGYVVFNKAAMADAKGRLPLKIKVKTVHGAAWTALDNSEFSEENEKMVLDQSGYRLDKEIGRICRKDVDQMVENVKGKK